MKLHVKNSSLGPCPHSFANFDELSIQHLLLLLTIDFEQRKLAGVAVLRVKRHNFQSKILKLDINRLVSIKNCSSVDGARSVKYDITQYSNLGDCLELDLSFLLQGKGDGSSVGSVGDDYVDVRIEYCVETVKGGVGTEDGKISGAGPGPSGPESPVKVEGGGRRLGMIWVDWEADPSGNYTSAVQWLNAEQTLGGYCGLAFSQAQAILARSFVPTQDTPAVKFTFDLYFESALPTVCSGEFVKIWQRSASSVTDVQGDDKLISIDGEGNEKIGIVVNDIDGCDGVAANGNGHTSSETQEPSFRIHPSKIPFTLNLPLDKYEIVTDDFEKAFPLPPPSEDDPSKYAIGDFANHFHGFSTRIYHFQQRTPIPAYLIAFLCGRISAGRIGKMSFALAEPEQLGAAVAELSGVCGTYLDIAINNVLRYERTEDEEREAKEVAENGGTVELNSVAYHWGDSYNVAVVPRSFAFGGMENPNITFFSASLLAGDQSLTTTLAHEIVHSWTGNLVTNRFHKDFWMNEGFTRYIERRILGQAFGPGLRALALTVGYMTLADVVPMMIRNGDGKFTKLDTGADLIGVDPDEAFSRVPYEKGSLFLYYLESVIIGGGIPELKVPNVAGQKSSDLTQKENLKQVDESVERQPKYGGLGEKLMGQWMVKYLNDFGGKSIETVDFKNHFISFFENKEKDLVEKRKKVNRRLRLEEIWGNFKKENEIAEDSETEGVVLDPTGAGVQIPAGEKDKKPKLKTLVHEWDLILSLAAKNEGKAQARENEVRKLCTKHDVDLTPVDNPPAAISGSSEAEIEEELSKPILALGDIDWDLWLNGEGLPWYKPRVSDLSMIRQSEDLAGYWLMENESYLSMLETTPNTPFKISLNSIRQEGDITQDSDDRKKYHAQQQMLFLDLLIASMVASTEGAGDNDKKGVKFHPQVLRSIDDLYGFGSQERCKNVEVKFRFLLLCVKNGMMEGEDEMNQKYIDEIDWFFGYHGRGSYNKPLYLGLKNYGGKSRELGLALFEKHQYFYQDTLRNTLGRVWGK